MLLGSAGGKSIGDLAAGVINEDARGPGLRARDLPARLITPIGISLPIGAERNPRAGVDWKLSLELEPIASSWIAIILSSLNSACVDRSSSSGSRMAMQARHGRLLHR